jgi:small subunit ribosomal protein S20
VANRQQAVCSPCEPASRAQGGSFTWDIFTTMPNTTSAKKRLRQNIARRSRNRSIKSAVRTQIRKLRSVVQSGDLTNAEKEFQVTAKKLDKAAASRVIHPNASARYKSRLQRLIRKAKQKQLEKPNA